MDLYLGRPDREWLDVPVAGEEVLAKSPGLLFYSEFNDLLADRTGFVPYDLSASLGHAQLGYALGLVVELNGPLIGAMISALVVNKSGRDEGRPSKGFFDLARRDWGLSTSARRDQEYAFWCEQVAKVLAYFKGR